MIARAMAESSASSLVPRFQVGGDITREIDLKDLPHFLGLCHLVGHS